MKYKYPRISNTLSYKKVDDNLVEVTDHLTDESYVFDIAVARYVRKLDGHTHPYKINSPLTRIEIDVAIDFLDEYGLIRRNNKIRISRGTKLKTLWIPQKTMLIRFLSKVSNTLLLILWFPILVFGIISFVNNYNDMDFEWGFLGYYIGLFFGLFCHELGHAFAGISYNARVFELGVMVMYGVMPGAYVLMDCSKVKKRMERIQINAAGVETNFLLAGSFLLSGSALHDLGGVFFYAAICNALLGILNLTFIKGFDGTSIISELLGKEGIVDCAKKIVFNKRIRKKVKHRGTDGYAIIGMSYIIIILQIALPVLLIMNVLEVIACFI